MVEWLLCHLAFAGMSLAFTWMALRLTRRHSTADRTEP